MKDKNKIINRIYLVLTLVFIYCSGLFVYKIYNLDILPKKYLIPFIMVITLITILFSCLLLIKKINSILKITPGFIVVVFIVLSMIGTNYINKTYVFMNDIKADNIILEDYYVVVKRDSSYYYLEDIRNQTVTTYSENTENYRQAKEDLGNKISVNYDYNDSVINMADDLLIGGNSIILISKSHMNKINEMIPNFASDTRIINTISTEEKIEKLTYPVERDIFSQAYTILISGMDDTENINNRATSLVNILVTVNPNTREILLTYIPKDYLVTIVETSNKDTINNVGLYGINKSIETIKSLLNIQINYYAKVNYNTLKAFVNLIDGVTVDNEFMRDDDVVNYARVNQDNLEKVINSVFNKITKTSDIFTKYTDLLDSISPSFETNISISNITNLVKLQLDNNASWTTKKYKLDGNETFEQVYTYGSSVVKVLEPNIDSLKQASLYINGIIFDKTFKELGL